MNEVWPLGILNRSFRKVFDKVVISNSSPIVHLAKIEG